MTPAILRDNLPPAVLFSIGVHLIVIFGFLVSPTGNSVVGVADRAVTVLLAPSEKAPAASTHYAAAHQEGLPRLQNPQRLLDDADIGTAINPRQAQGAGLSMSEADAAPRSPTVAAVASPDAEYLRRWQDRIERFGNAYYRGLALQHGDGDVRLRVIIAADGALQRIDLLSSSGAKALDQAAIHTVKELAPFAPFSSTLASTTSELAIVRTWQFRR